MKQKAQAAMEFLMTYGWAILVVLAAIGALAYFGVLSPGEFLPEQCVLIPGLSCLDFNINTNSTVILISNSLGNDIDISTVTIGNCSNSLNQTLKNGDKITVTLTGCSNGASGAKFKEDVTVAYSKQETGFLKTAVGKMTGIVQ